MGSGDYSFIVITEGLSITFFGEPTLNQTIVIAIPSYIFQNLPVSLPPGKQFR